MSQLKQYTITCPNCGTALEASLYESLNIDQDESLRELLIKNEVNRITCDNCEFSFVIDKPLLYNDPLNDIMIYWLPLEGDSIENGQQRFRDFIHSLTQTLPSDIYAPQVHLVFDRIELLERIFVLECDLDERIIEYMKYMIYTRNPEKVDPQHKILLFNAQDSTAEQLCFIFMDDETRKVEGMLQYSRDVYASLDEMFDQDDQTANLLEFFPGPYINARYLVMKELQQENADNSSTPPS